VTSTTPITPLEERALVPTSPVERARAAVARIKAGDLGSLPVVVGLVGIWLFFQNANSNFLSARNLTNLATQSAAVGTIAVGIVLVLLLGEIDLSVGSVSGLGAAVCGVLFINQEWPLWAAVGAAVLAGASVGLVYGVLYTRFGVPSFVITLAGLLGVLGLHLQVLGKQGTLNLPFDSGLVHFFQTYLPEEGSYVLCVAAVGALVGTRFRRRSRRLAAGLTADQPADIAVVGAVLAVLVVVPTYVFNQYRGVPAPFVFFLGVVVGMDLLLRCTTWGRSVYAIGGNVEAARRAGLPVKRIYVSVFVLTAVLASVGGLLAAGKLNAVNQSSGGSDTNLNAIAAAVIGGTSLFGGRGRASSALLGMLVIGSISNGLALLQLDSPVRYMITGGVLLVAVITDSLSRRTRTASGRA
jgi:D-xylose transport system permease protein